MGSKQRLTELGPEGFMRLAARVADHRRHRHHLPRRPPVAARDPRTHQGHARRRPDRRPHPARTALPGVLGRCHLRRGPALPRRGPLGAAGRPARGRPQHLPADAAARPQHRGLHPVPDRGDRRLRAGGGSHRHRHLPHLRRAERRQPDAPRHRGGTRHGHLDRRGRPLLHLGPVRPERTPLHPRLLPAPGRADRRRGRPRPGRQGHGGPAARPRRGEAGVGSAPRVRPPGAHPHP